MHEYKHHSHRTMIMMTHGTSSTSVIGVCYCTKYLFQFLQRLDRDSTGSLSNCLSRWI
jgi:hypothetical protein